MNTPRSRLWNGLAAVALCGAVAAAYWPALHGGLLWDDDGHVTRPGLQSAAGLLRIWTEPGASQQYYPLLHTAFWLEHRLWGDAVLGYHAANVALHLCASLLFLRVLQRLEVRGAWFAAWAFALHPVCVESVAWISEQKNTLSAVFYFAAALAYLRFDEDRGRRWYGAASLLFVMALLSKSVTATLPAALLVVAWWRRGRLSFRADVAPLLPWFGAALASGAVTEWMETHVVGASGGAFSMGAAARVLVAGRALWFYFAKVVWPEGLAFNYPRWAVDPASAAQYLYPVAAAAALGALLAVRSRTRAPLAAALLFAGTLFPALGFVNVYPFVFSFVADHFQYLAAALMIAALAGGLAAAAARLPAPWRRAGIPAAAGVLAVLWVLSRGQAGHYRDAETFYRTMLASNPQSWLAHDNLGVVLTREGRDGEAAGHYLAAMQLNPDYPEAFNNYGNLLARAGRWSEAGRAYAGALRARPWFTDAEVNWGNALSEAGRFDEAQAHFRNALAVRPDDGRAHYGLANALANRGDLGAAVGEYLKAIALYPGQPDAHLNLGLALAKLDRWEEAKAQIREASAERPDRAASYAAMAHAYHALALAQQGRLEGAAAEFREALSGTPGDPEIHYQLAQVLRRLGRLEEAGEELEAASRSSQR